MPYAGLALELQRVFQVKARSGDVHKPVCCVCVAAPEGPGLCVVQGEGCWLCHCVCWPCIVPRDLGPGGESLRSRNGGPGGGNFPFLVGTVYDRMFI